MSISQRNATRLHVAYRAAETLTPKGSAPPTATEKAFLAVQIVSQFNHVQGKGVSDDQ